MGLKAGFTAAPDPLVAARELHAALDQPNLELVLLFVSRDHANAPFAEALAAAFGDVPVVGCTTAGEVTPAGYREGTVAGVSFASPDFIVRAGLLDGLRDFEIRRANEVVQHLLAELKASAPPAAAEPPTGRTVVGFALIDGMAQREETVMTCLDGALGGMPLFGGSAGDGLRFESTSVLWQGRFRDDAAILVLLSTKRPIKVFWHQHFVSSDQKLVVTRADPAHRIVHELNAEPAVVEYARLAGLAVDDLAPMDFATHPLVVKLGGAEYVRSIQKANADGSLTFYCAIDEGLVLTLAEGRDLLSHVEQLFQAIRQEVGPPELVLGFDCILRKLELQHTQSQHKVAPLFAANNVVGFSTFGEQIGSMHVTQTFTGVAIGRGAPT
jgi:hypothetical protein